MAASLLLLAGLAGAAGQDAGSAGRPFGPWSHHRPGPPPLGDVLARHAGELGLDADTLARIRVIAETARAEEQPLVEQLGTLHQAMHKLLDADAPKADDVMQQADQIGAMETALRKHQLGTLLEIRALLTPEQRQKLVQIFAERKARWHAREGGGAPPGAPDDGAPEPPPPDAP
jgi:Spy/CpxP family protein refolding chaperone